MKCPNCDSSNIKLHENLPNNRARYRCKNCNADWRDEQIEKQEVEKEEEIDGDVRRVSTKSLNITSVDELIKYSKIDTDAWEISKSRVKTSEVTISGKNTASGKPETYTNYHVSAELKKKESYVSPELDIEQLKNDAKNYAPVYEPIHHKDKIGGTLLEISLFDHHFGQLSWGEETGSQNYDISISHDLAHHAIDKIITRADWSRIERILLVTGNDFFNVDTILNTTMGGTPQAEDGRWKKTYTRGRKLWVSIIEKLMKHAPVDVINVLGNHGPQREYYLGDSLECWFHNCDSVTIDNSPQDRKYYTYGNVLLGFTHGHKEVKNTLPTLMATQEPEKWSKSKFREWHLGHWHAASGKIFQVLDEDHGVRQLVLPSLVPLDDWHSGKGYSALRQTIAMEWSKENGQISSIVVNAV